MGVESGDGNWIPLVEYSAKRGVSLSTLRRYIKSNKIKHKLEDGRYLLFDDGKDLVTGRKKRDESILMQKRIKKLEAELQKAHEEIAELKTLIALYEEKIPERIGT